MDMKALAKSKRAHSLHHSKKNNLHQASKVPSTSSGDKKPTGKAPRVKPQQSHNARPLPSNWDRYNEELNMGSEDLPMGGPSQPTEFILPKSKGADYAHLISEAKAQAQSNYPSEAFPSFEDNTYSFTQDFGPMLSARGHSIFSWTADDTFEFESKPSSNLRAPFLSLNLDALAEQLAKSKLSERLFLEPDTLPLELLDDELQPFSEDKQGLQTSTPVPTDSEATLACNQGEEKNIQPGHELILSHTATSKNFSAQAAEEEMNSTKHVNNDDQIKSAAEKAATFEAANAEDELDMLLSSFTETKIFESSGASTTGNSSNSAALSGKGTHIARHATAATKIDAAIDDLLEETFSKTETVSDQRGGVKAVPGDVSKSKILDDFDSWLDTI